MLRICVENTCKKQIREKYSFSTKRIFHVFKNIVAANSFSNVEQWKRVVNYLYDVVILLFIACSASPGHGPPK